jgi:hypothetical protein
MAEHFNHSIEHIALKTPSSVVQVRPPAPSLKFRLLNVEEKTFSRIESHPMIR